VSLAGITPFATRTNQPKIGYIVGSIPQVLGARIEQKGEGRNSAAQVEYRQRM